jgi:hypothetical protein
MNRILRVLLILLWLEVGFVLILLPWSAFWEANYFLDRFPLLIPLLLSPYLRGTISGLGLMDAALALHAFRRGPATLAKRS